MQAPVPGSVLVAGATGSLGRHIVRELGARGARVRILSRRADPATAGGDIEAVRGDVLVPQSLGGCCAGIETVISCVGASLDLYAWRLASRALARIQPRLSDLFELAAAVSTGDFVAPRRGTRRLADHFRELAG